jgi:hypothetical protein
VLHCWIHQLLLQQKKPLLFWCWDLQLLALQLLCAWVLSSLLFACACVEKLNLLC